MHSFAQDLKYALRGLRARPGFTAAAVFALALGIGANTAIFSAVNAVLLNSLPLRQLKDPGRLVMVWEKNPSLTLFLAERMPVCLRNFVEWKKASRSFEDMALWGEASFNLTDPDDTAGRRPEEAAGGAATAEFFPLLGIQPRLGRTFTVEDTRPGKAHVTILSDELWRSRFASDPGVVGRMLRAGNIDYRIIGVLPPGFELPAMWEGFDQKKPKMWVPLDTAPGGSAEAQRQFFVYARLKRGVSLQQARAEMNVIGWHLVKALPDIDPPGMGVNVFPVAVEDVSPTLRRSLLVLQVAVGFVLLIACANVANLLLARAVGREREMGIRLALGAGRWRIVRQMLTEGLVLSAIGALLGLLLSYWGMALVSAFAPDTHGFHELRLDPLVLAFTVGVAVTAGFLFGLAPALHASSQSVSQTLNRAGRSGGGGSSRLRSALVVTEVALSLVLLCGDGLTIRSLILLMTSDQGFRPDHLLTMRATLPDSKYASAERAGAFADRVLESVRGVPGVQAASLSSAVPLQSVNENSYDVEGAPPLRAGTMRMASFALVRDGYFRTMGIPFLRGRDFSSQEIQSQQRVVVVNQAFARENWPGQDAIGRIVIPSGGERFRIVGVVDDEHQMGADTVSRPEIYVPTRSIPAFYLIVRTVGDPLAMAPAVQRCIWNVDKEQPVSDVHSMQGVIREWTGERRFIMSVLIAFAVVALLLAAVGLYGVLAYSITLRTREIGVRVALGAEPGQVARLIAGEGLKLAVGGVAVGIAAALALTGLMQKLIFGISASDPLTFTLVSLVLIAVALAASWLPARRASRIDPMEALRVE